MPGRVFITVLHCSGCNISVSISAPVTAERLLCICINLTPLADTLMAP